MVKRWDFIQARTNFQAAKAALESARKELSEFNGIRWAQAICMRRINLCGNHYQAHKKALYELCKRAELEGMES